MSEIVIVGVQPGSVKPAKPKPVTRESAGITHHIEQFAAMKHILEHLFGPATYARLKYASFDDWRQASRKAFKAIRLSIKERVAVADDLWRDDVEDAIAHGERRISYAANMAELFNVLAASFIELSFVLAGGMPPHARGTRPLTKEYWGGPPLRSPQYVQADWQKENAKTEAERRRKNRERIEADDR